MAERQVRSRSQATDVEAATRESESCHESRELMGNTTGMEIQGNKKLNAQIEVQIGGQKQQSPDNQVNIPEKSDDIIQMFSKQLDR